MSSAFVHGDSGVFGEAPVPVCQWSFNRAHQFHHVGGDSAGFFDRPPAELLHRHVSTIDDPQGSWSARLNRMFLGQARIEQWSAAMVGGDYALFHIAVGGHDGEVTYVAGFAFPAKLALPAPSELELAAVTALQAVESERTRATRFLHDVVAQSLSGTGLQLELLQLEIRARNGEGLKCAAEIQQSLEEVLKLIREFNTPE